MRRRNPSIDQSGSDPHKHLANAIVGTDGSQAQTWEFKTVGAVGRSLPSAAHLLNAFWLLTGEFYKVDVAAITAQVKQEFAAKEKARTTTKPAPKAPIKAPPKTAKKAAAA